MIGARNERKWISFQLVSIIINVSMRKTVFDVNVNSDYGFLLSSNKKKAEKRRENYEKYEQK